MIRVQQLKLPVGHTREELEQALFRELGIPGKNVRSWSIQKQSLDARKRPISLVYRGNLKFLCENPQIPYSIRQKERL